MNCRKDFLEWMKKEKGTSFFDSRKTLWQLDALNITSRIFAISSVDELPQSDSPELKLYAEFLGTKFSKKKQRVFGNSANEVSAQNNLKEDILSVDNIIYDEIKNQHSNSERDSSTEVQLNSGLTAIQGKERSNTGLEDTERIQKGTQEDTKSKADIAQEDVSDVISDLEDYELFRDYIVSNSEKEILDRDYVKKRNSYSKLKKMSFQILSDIYDNAYAATQVSDCQYSIGAEKELPANLVFDVVSGQVADLSDGTIKEMTSYVYYLSEQKEHRFSRNNQAFYYPNNIPRQESTASAFLKCNPSIDVIQRSIRDTISRQKRIAVDTKSICLVPDNLGDFRDTIKSQIRSSSSNVIQIPRSIAAVYSFVQQYHLDQDTSFVCYDYNSSDLCRTEIRVHYNEETGRHEFTRMRRQRMLSGSHFNFDKVASSYLKAYAEKYQVNIPPRAIKTLIETRDILRIINKGKSIPLEVDGDIISIDYDCALVDDIASLIMEEVNSDNFDSDYCCALLDLNTSINGFCTLEYLLSGCYEIQDRLKNHEDIWIEYLPELSLEVIRNGTFDNLKLIDKGMIQRISESTMEEVVIPLKDGRFSLPIRKGKVFCPLIREEWGNRQRDKMAMFDDNQIDELAKAFGKEANFVQVDLTLTYHYGDPDSYRLTAAPCDSPNIQIQSQWCNEADQIMGNSKFPEYSSPNIKYNADIDTVDHALQETIKRFSNSRNYTMSGGYQGKPPFDEYDHWLALKQMTRIRLSLPQIFSPASIGVCSASTISNVEEFLEKALDIYYKCENGTLDSGNIAFPCNLDGQYLDNIKFDLLDIMSLMGGICVTSGVLEQTIIDNMVDCILSNKIQYILALSTHITRDNDYYGVWNKIDERLENASGVELRSAIRALSSVCWRQPNWIYQFGKCPDYVLQLVIDTIIAVCESEANKVSSGFNPRTIRDMLEALLGISRLKETNHKVLELLNCNNKNIKQFIVVLKEFNETVRSVGDSLKYPLESRLRMEVPEELHNVYDSLYPIIEILTDGNAVKLTGFAEE